ncbi:MAG: hypothetical protein NTU63_01365 [Candidatus Pacearchaeota archaeon]|nr:hypothetical protein [Candidatus Pacearchaeota archaeon]
MKIKFTWKIWLWIIFLLLSLLSIFYNPNYFLQKGVIITSIEQNSTAFEQGLRTGQIITGIDNQPVENIKDFSNIMEGKFNSNETIKTTITTKDEEYVFYSNQTPDLFVSEIPKTNLKLGLDLIGGSRALIEAEDHKLTKQEVNDLAQIIENRLNVFGVSDVKVIPRVDLSGDNRLSIEIAGATPKDLEELISKQGKFEARIGNETVFIGGEKDITSVARSGQESGIYQCEQAQSGYFCTFRFTVYLSEKAAQRQANITSNLSVNSTSQGNYLSEKLNLYLDDKFYSSLLISENLKGRAETQIQISGSGSGPTKTDAYNAAEEEMNKLQTVLITGSLPFKLKIVKLDTISPTLGKNFTKYILIAGAVALLSVVIIIFIKYRKIKISIPPLIICTSEIIITLGIAALMKWDLDLPSIAGILAAIGTGVDDQIVMLDEAEHKEFLSIKQRIKRAFAIILGAYFTSVASLLPLWWAGAGLLRGFVFTTITGITIGVLVTRPAFADIVNMIEQ